MRRGERVSFNPQIVYFFFLTWGSGKKHAERKRWWGLAGMRRWNWNRSQWIRKQDSSFCLVVQPCIFCALHRSFCEPPCPAASRWWLIPRAELATETERIMHKRWVQFIVFSWGPGGEQKLWIYVERDWSRAHTQGTDVQHGDWSWGGVSPRSCVWSSSAGPPPLPQTSLYWGRWKLTS